MFIGEHSHNIDEKGRLAMPARFRGAFADGLVMTRGLDGCLFIYTKQDWNELAEKLVDMPLSQAGARQFARHMLAGAMDAELDKQGRVIVPSYLRQFAKLESAVVVAGLYNRIEVWNTKSWSEQQKQAESKSDEIAQSLLDFGI